MSYNKLKGRIIDKFGNIDNFSCKLKMSRCSLYRKMSNKGEFSQGEIAEISELLSIPQKEIGSYFFAD